MNYDYSTHLTTLEFLCSETLTKDQRDLTRWFFEELENKPNGDHVWGLKHDGSWKVFSELIAFTIIPQENPNHKEPNNILRKNETSKILFESIGQSTVSDITAEDIQNLKTRMQTYIYSEKAKTDPGKAKGVGP